MLTAGADPVRKISIIPRGQSLGVTFSAPDADRFNYSEQELRAKIKVALGGRAAEELVFGDLTTGAESDIQQLTQIARQMVGPLGHEPRDRNDRRPAVGRPRAAAPGRGRGLGGDAAADRRGGAPARRGVPREGRALLAENRDKLDSLAHALLEHETLDQPDAYAAAGLTPVAAALPA